MTGLHATGLHATRQIATAQHAGPAPPGGGGPPQGPPPSAASSAQRSARGTAAKHPWICPDYPPRNGVSPHGDAASRLGRLGQSGTTGRIGRPGNHPLLRHRLTESTSFSGPRASRVLRNLPGAVGIRHLGAEMSLQGAGRCLAASKTSPQGPPSSAASAAQRSGRRSMRANTACWPHAARRWRAA